ncbi:hypothetical protein [Methylorubrum populi]|uniref:Uncharacterized protein n=1 Tax=Methylorubrum populi TaxID=223967 RepID=A0A833MXM1_9HYPH|nr:hypothetical protein [Methylorubrum populi]KAB7785367.1 hypothetical protein F8B43_1868 [Methylorubrum populi]
MTNRVRIRAVATDQARMVVIEAEGSGHAVEALVTAALGFVGGGPGERGPAPQPALAPPKKPRRRRP